MATELQKAYIDLMHELDQEREVVAILLEALGGEYVLGDTTEIIEGTSNREFLVVFEEGKGYVLKLVHVPQKVGKLYQIPEDPEAIPCAGEGAITDIRPLTDEERTDIEEDDD